MGWFVFLYYHGMEKEKIRWYIFSGWNCGEKESELRAKSHMGKDRVADMTLNDKRL
jgi:hypothetical protein